MFENEDAKKTQKQHRCVIYRQELLMLIVRCALLTMTDRLVIVAGLAGITRRSKVMIKIRMVVCKISHSYT